MNLNYKKVVTLFALALIATLVFIGCQQSNDENTHPAKKYKVTLEKAINGNVTASFELPQDGMVEENKEITFTATGNKGYIVDSWTISAGTFIEGGNKGSETAKIKVSRDVTIGVTFAPEEEGVWKMLSMQIEQNGKTQTVEFPKTNQAGVTLQPYLCLSEGILYGAHEVTGSADSTQNGMFQLDDMWKLPYKYSNNSITINSMSMSFVIEGNKTTMTDSKGMITKLEKVTSPTVAEIKAATYQK